MRTPIAFLVLALLSIGHSGRLGAEDARTFAGIREQKARALSYQQLFISEQFHTLDEIASRLRTEKPFADPYRWELFNFYDALDELVELNGETKTIQLAELWTRKRPHSPTAPIVLTGVLIKAAWRQRGSGDASTVSPGSGADYAERMKRAAEVHATARGLSSQDPQFVHHAIELAEEMGGGDGRAIAREAARWTHYPHLFRVALMYQRENWGGNTADYRAFVEEASLLTAPTLKDSMYAYLAYQTLFFVFDDERKRIGFDPARMARSCQAMIDVRPKWVPSYHRCARLAAEYRDTATLKKLFARPELGWYDGADGIWISQSVWEHARDAARGEQRQTPQQSQTQLGVPPPVLPAPNPPLTSGRTPPPPTRRWPPIVMQSEQTFRMGEVYRNVISFLVQTPRGVMAVSSVSLARPRTFGTNVVEHARAKLVAWRMFPPKERGKVFTVDSIVTTNTARDRSGVLLSLRPFKGKLPVEVLTVAPRPEDFAAAVYVVGCDWKENVCTQIVLHGEITSWDSNNGFSVGIQDDIDPAAFVGAPVLDEAGQAIGVVDGRVLGTRRGVHILLNAEELDRLLPP